MRKTLASLLSIAVLAGCGSDEPAEPLPYGGEVLVNHFVLPDGSNVVRLSAYFIAAQDPQFAPDDVPIGECGPDHSYDQADARQYIDVGESVSFHFGDGADHVVSRLLPDPDNEDCSKPGVPCADGVMDFLGRLHDIAYVEELFAPELGDGFLMGEDAVTTADPQSFSDQLRVLQPPRIELESPDRPDDYTITFTDRQAVTFTWQQAAPVMPVTDRTMRIYFAPSGASVATTCVAPDTGSFTVPAAVIDGLQSSSGFMLFIRVNRATIMTDSGRAIDVRAEDHVFAPFSRTSSVTPSL